MPVVVALDALPTHASNYLTGNEFTAGQRPCPGPRASLASSREATRFRNLRYLVAGAETSGRAESLVPSKGTPYTESSPPPTENTSGPKQFASIG